MAHRDIEQALTWANEQIQHPTRDWHELCLSFCRSSYGLPPVAPSAIDLWHKIPHHHKHQGPADAAPRGAFVYFDYPGAGHVTLKARHTLITTDYCHIGKVCHAPLDLPAWHGSHYYLGWSLWTPDGFLDQI